MKDQQDLETQTRQMQTNLQKPKENEPQIFAGKRLLSENLDDSVGSKSKEV